MKKYIVIIFLLIISFTRSQVPEMETDSETINNTNIELNDAQRAEIYVIIDKEKSEIEEKVNSNKNLILLFSILLLISNLYLIILLQKIKETNLNG